MNKAMRRSVERTPRECMREKTGGWEGMFRFLKLGEAGAV